MNEAIILEKVVPVIDLGDICQDRGKVDCTPSQPKIYDTGHPISSTCKPRMLWDTTGRKKLWLKKLFLETNNSPNLV